MRTQMKKPSRSSEEVSTYMMFLSSVHLLMEAMKRTGRDPDTDEIDRLMLGAQRAWAKWEAVRDLPAYDDMPGFPRQPRPEMDLSDQQELFQILQALYEHRLANEGRIREAELESLTAYVGVLKRLKANPSRAKMEKLLAQARELWAQIANKSGADKPQSGRRERTANEEVR